MSRSDEHARDMPHLGPGFDVGPEVEGFDAAARGAQFGAQLVGGGGIDLAIDPTPHDRFSDRASAPEPAGTAPTPTSRQAPASTGTAPRQAPPMRAVAAAAALSQDAAAQSAREIARGARNLEELRAASDATLPALFGQSVHE